MEAKLRKYIFPSVLAMLGTSCYILADTLFISIAAGTNGITALNLVLPVYGIIYALGSMIGIGSATRYSLSKSLGNKDANDYFSNALFFTILLSLFFVVLGVFFPDWVLQILGADKTILEVGHSYIQIVLCFAPCFMANYTLTAFVRNDHSPKIAMAATLISGIFNIIFDYILMFPLQMGMSGAALATGISPIVSMSICMLHYLSEKSSIRLVLKAPSLKKLISSCHLGIVAFVGEISSGITTMVFNFVLLGLGGNLAVAAYGVIANIALVGTSLLNGVSQGLQPLASSVHGVGDSSAEKHIYRHSLQIGGMIAVLLTVGTFLFTSPLVSIFNTENSQALKLYAESGLRLYFLGFLFAFINIIKSGFLSATGKGSQSAFIALSRGVVAIVFFAVLLAKWFGITGVWLAFPVCEAFTCVMSFLVSWWKFKKENLL